MKNKQGKIRYYKAFIINEDTGEQRNYLVFDTEDQTIKLSELTTLLFEEKKLYDKFDMDNLVLFSHRVRGNNSIVVVDSKTYEMPQFLMSLDAMNNYKSKGGFYG